MELWVVTSNMMDGRDALCVFEAQAEAKAYAEVHRTSAATIELRRVHGADSMPNDVYAAHEYLPSPDVHFFVALYADYDDAKTAAGYRGVVKRIGPDASPRVA